jgi:hypothetical protein
MTTGTAAAVTGAAEGTRFHRAVDWMEAAA